MVNQLILTYLHANSHLRILEIIFWYYFCSSTDFDFTNRGSAKINLMIFTALFRIMNIINHIFKQQSNGVLIPLQEVTTKPITTLEPLSRMSIMWQGSTVLRKRKVFTVFLALVVWFRSIQKVVQSRLAWTPKVLTIWSSSNIRCRRTSSVCRPWYKI